MDTQFADTAERRFHVDDAKSRAFLMDILANIAHGVVVVGKDGFIDAVNDVCHSILGVTGSLLGRRFREIFDPAAPRLASSEKEREEFYKRTRERVPFAQEIALSKAGDSERWVSVLYNPMPSGGFVLTLTDITQQKETEEQLRHQATHDPLTKLPNKVLFQNHIQMVLALAKRGNATGCILFLDLDNFKDVNDRHGHEVGDGLLAAVASRLRSVVREYDTVARLGGDEFIMLLPEIKPDEGMENLLFRIQGAFWEPFQINGIQLKVSMSLGVSRYPRDGLEMKALIRKADIAMYAAKQGGKNTWRFYESSMKNLCSQV